MANSFKRDWIISLLAYGCVLILLATAFATNLLSPRLFAFAVLLSAVAFFLVLVRMFRKAYTEGLLVNQTSLLSLKQIKRRLLWSKIGIVFWSALAAVGLWETRGGPLAPRLIRLCVSLAFLIGSIVSLRQSRKTLQQQRSGD
jgi:hypothetical protein